MPEPVLWPLDDHTRAKHKVLAAYLNAWIPVMGQQALKVAKFGISAPRLLIVDGFAGPGRYTGGEEGSPLIMLNALVDHTALSRMAGVKFIFLFIEQDIRRFEYLRGQVDGLSLPPNVEVHVEHGAFENTFGSLVDGIKGNDKTLIPTFAFVDPFGYSTASMSLAGRFLDFPRSEALFFLPLSFVHRFVGREGQEEALTSLFDTDRWKDAIPLEGEARRTFLLNLFMEQLRRQGQVKYVTSFELRTHDGNDYRLVFATGHQRGLELMKSAMWSVDPLQGTRYTAHTETGQQVLFQPHVDTGPLLEELRATFGKKWFTVLDASKAMLETPYVPSSHLKRLTLVPAEKAGLIQVKRPEEQRAGTFTDEVRMRFT
jgi:three-Cys-motif partner protein